MQVACQIPAQGEVTVPQELFAEGERQHIVLCRFHVPFLQFVVVAYHLGVERDVLRQPVQSEPLEDVEPFGPALDQPSERLPGPVHRCPVVVQCAPPVVLILIDGRLARCMRVGMAVG